MNTKIEITEAKDRKAILSTLWIFVMFNYVYADLLLFNSSAYTELLAKMNEWVILGVVALFEVSIVMVLLPQVLGYRANRWANIIVGLESTVFVAFTLLGGAPAPWYKFIATIEIATTLFIVWYAWTWPNPEGKLK